MLTLGRSRMFWGEVSEVPYFSVDHDPAIFGLVVGRDLVNGKKLVLGHCERVEE
jgi:hypothetical protein